MKVTVILEYLESPSDNTYEVTGRSGYVYGYAVPDQARDGRHCLRLTLEEYRAAKADLCTAQRRFFYPIFDVEVEEGEVADSEALDKLRAEIADLLERNEELAGQVKSLGERDEIIATLTAERDALAEQLRVITEGAEEPANETVSTPPGEPTPAPDGATSDSKTSPLDALPNVPMEGNPSGLKIEALELDALSIEELRKLARDRGLQGLNNAKPETIIAKLTALDAETKPSGE